jgi:DNA-binding IclR family transcriptional regulator
MLVADSSRQIGVPAQVVIADHVVSVQQLEILLLLRRYREQWCTAVQVNDHLHGGRNTVRRRLEELAMRGLVIRSDAGFRYGPPYELGFALAMLAAVSAERHETITSLFLDAWRR